MYPVREKDKAWLTSLNKMGYNVKTRAIKVTPNGIKSEKRIDVLMSVDIVSSAFERKSDSIVIVSGDSDFVPVVKKLKELNKKIEVWAFVKLLSQQLKTLIEPINLYYLDDYLDQIKLE